MMMDPTVSPDTRKFWEAASEGRLVVPTCDRGHAPEHWLPPVGVCPLCRSQDVEWREAEPVGELKGWVTYRRQYLPEFPTPYSVGLVELRHGPRLTILLDVAGEDDLHFGASISIGFRRVAGQTVVPVGALLANGVGT